MTRQERQQPIDPMPRPDMLGVMHTFLKDILRPGRATVHLGPDTKQALARPLLETLFGPTA